MPRYITVPITSDSRGLLNLAVQYLQGKFPTWRPAEGNLDYLMLSAISLIAAELAVLASEVPDTIFRYMGNSLFLIPPIDSTPATVTTDWTMNDNAGYTVPAGTQVGIAVTGDITIPFFTTSDITVVPGQMQALGVIMEARDPGSASSGLGSIGGAMVLIDPLDFVASITQENISTGGVDAELDSDYLDRLVDELQLLAPRPILPSDFAGMAINVAGIERAIAIDGYNPDYNALTANQASAETDATGWAATTNGNAPVQDAVHAADGTHSIKMQATAGGDMAYRTPPTLSGAGAVPCVPGETWTAIVSVLAGATARSVHADLRYYDNSGVLVGTSVGIAANDSTSGWTVYMVTGVVPVGAFYVHLRVYVVGAVASEIHYADKASLHRGSSTNWTIGTFETNNARMVAVGALDVAGVPVSFTVKAALQAYLTARREVNFVINVIDPMIVSIDVTTTVKMLPGFLASDVIARIEAALASYLSAASWGIPPGGSLRDWVTSPYVRYTEIVTVINNVQGVDYITGLTMGYHGGAMSNLDIALPGSISMPSAGTITAGVS